MEFWATHPHINGSQAYYINLGEIKIVFGGGMDLTSLLHFQPTTFKNEPYKKINSEENDKNLLLKGPIKLDLTYLLALNLSEIDIFVLTSFQDIFIVPYLCSHPHF